MNPSFLLVQIFNGLVNGSFYALLSLGLAVIFGMLDVVNFAHGALYMLGAFAAFLLLQGMGLGFWPALVLAPIAVGILGMILERLFIRRLYPLGPLYNLLLTYGLSLVITGTVRLRFGEQTGQPYAIPKELAGATSLGVVMYPTYRLFVIVFSLVVCLGVWYLIERTRVGMVVRAATEKADLTRALGIKVDRWVTPVFGFGVALAALAGVLAAPMRVISPDMGSALIATTFAVVVVGGMGSILGAVIAGFMVGFLEGLGTVFFPPITATLPFVLMAIVLLVRPEGLFGSMEAK